MRKLILLSAVLLAGCGARANAQCGSLRNAVLEFGRVNTPGVVLGKVYRLRDNVGDDRDQMPYRAEPIASIRTTAVTGEELERYLADPGDSRDPLTGSWVTDGGCLGMCCQLAKEPVKKANVGKQDGSLTEVLNIEVTGADKSVEASIKAEVKNSVSLTLKGGTRHWMVAPVEWQPCDVPGRIPFSSLEDGARIAIVSEVVDGTLVLKVGNKVGAEARASVITTSAGVDVNFKCDEALEIEGTGTFGLTFGKWNKQQGVLEHDDPVPLSQIKF